MERLVPTAGARMQREMGVEEQRPSTALTAAKSAELATHMCGALSGDAKALASAECS